MERRVDSSYAAKLDHAVDYEIDVAEEYGHISHGSEPELNSGVAGESGLHPEPSGNETCGHQEGSVFDVSTDIVGSHQHDSRRDELSSCGEAELNAKHDREIDRHADQRGISRHEDIFLHQRCGADHVRGRGQVKTSRKLDNQYEENEEIGLETPRNDVANFRNVERPLWSVPICHVSISRYIPHSCRL